MEKFLRDRVNELHSVTWPTQKQAVHSMVTVIVIMLLTGLGLGAIDFILNEAVLSFLR